MASSLSVITALEKSKIDSDVAFLAALKIQVIDPATGSLVETLNVIRNNEPLTINGVVHTPTIFDITFSHESAGAGSVTLSINDYTGALQSRMEQYGGGVGFLVEFTIVNAGNLSAPPELREYFEVVGSSSQEYQATFILGASSFASRVFPRSVQRKDFCRWKYKDAKTCGYTGSLPSCDMTLKGANGCSVHVNSRRFGGFPGLRTEGVRYG